MVVPKKGRRLGGNGSHQKAIMRNLTISLFDNGEIAVSYTHLDVYKRQDIKFNIYI